MPMNGKGGHSGRGKVWLDFLLFPDIVIMGILFLAGAAFTVSRLGHALTWVWLVFGMMVYAAGEYVTHRFLFHKSPPKNRLALKLLRRLHYDHHVRPDDLHLLFLPIWYSLPNIAAAGAIFYAAARRWDWTIVFITGLIGYLLYYEWKHYVAHRPLRPITPWGRWLKKLHLLHHYKNERYWYGVTNPALDRLLGTWAEEAAVDKSETARNLEKNGPSAMR
jgi:4-hydroxysphinganine ceramide fatty acyl 2-hydroxylase